ncbi:MAG: hypothetical protein IIZ46_08185 [Clostridia bacterium]|nr:hypothetical protein [Clostridia bacterium]
MVYNFEVKDFHTYYVTDTGVLVHNADKSGGENQKKNPSERAEEKGYPGIKITENGGSDFSGTDYIRYNT